MKSAPERKTFPFAASAGLFLVAVVVIVGLCAGLYSREASLVEQRVRDREMVRAGLLSQVFRSDLQSVANTLRLLADGDGLHLYLTTGRSEDLERAAYRAVFVSRQQPSFDQVRYLDERGQEIIRTNQGGVLVAPEKLQNKSDRPYFRDATSLAPGKILVSPFDLNIENGRIEEPFKPVLRFSTPVFDAEGKRRGVYVINYLGKDLLDHLQRATVAQQRRLRLLNRQGYWLKAADPAQEWGFMLPGRADFSLAKTDPELWSRIAQETEGQTRKDGGLFTWQLLTPQEFTGEGGRTVENPDYLVVASEVSVAEWELLFIGLKQSFSIVALGLIILAASSLWFFNARTRSEARVSELNNELRARASELEFSNAELESFSYSVSHDLRAPLRHVQGYVEMLTRELRGNLSEKAQHHLTVISKAARDMGELIDNLLAFSRMGRTEIREVIVDPNLLIQEGRKTLELATRDRNIQWTLPSLPKVQGDASMIRQVFVNLLGNAVKYTRNRAKAEITVGCSGEENGREIFFVRDNGAGFDMKYADKLFGVFQRLHRVDEFEGTGIGLANVRRIIQRHGGRTWATGEVGAGATFYFTLKPAAAKD